MRGAANKPLAETTYHHLPMLIDRARNAYQSWRTRPAGFPLAREGRRRTRRVRSVVLPDRPLQLLSFNIQAGIGTRRYREYVTGSWKNVVAHPRSVETIERIAEVVRQFDVVGLQEVDGGSLRSRNLNQLVHLASLAEFPFWHQQLNRNLGRLGQFSNGLLSRYTPYAVEDHALPGLPGRGAILIKYGHPVEPLVVVVAHLALGERMRQAQLGYLAALLRPFRYKVLMGDFNCRPDQLESTVLGALGMRIAQDGLLTYPSWEPDRHIDYILTSPELAVRQSRVLEDCRLSDHLPLAAEIDIPESVRAAIREHGLPKIE